ncbi:MAG: hypothetical protein A2048_06715 [Deltaproteobacteria bacterium GWA2_45_12]|nr:MAG: hypothetical protein A2048_06715 [Deltaproteobacteria bacterium GWA2_45_12]
MRNVCILGKGGLQAALTIKFSFRKVKANLTKTMAEDKDQFIVGVDLGGTYVRAGLVDRMGEITQMSKRAVDEIRSQKAVVDLLMELMGTFPKEKVAAISLGVPGIVNAAMGVVHASPHFSEWKDFALQKEIFKNLKKSVFIDNDANRIALGEHWKGAAQEWDTFLMLTLGTGIGGAIIINSQIFHGTHGFTGEFGHIVVEASGPSCPCGGRGCLETFASGSGLVRNLKEVFESDEDSLELKPIASLLGQESSTIVAGLASQAEKGNLLARDMFLRFGYYLGIGLASLVSATGIQKIILGGGISASSGLFLNECRQEMKNRLYAKTFEGVEIRLAKLGDRAGILGSGLVALQHLKK